jgi:uncharacterized protein (TIGR02599 family)
MRSRFRLQPLNHHSLGFSLLELLVTIGVLCLFVVLLFSVTDLSFRLWRRTSSDIAMFDAARAAYDILTRRLSQATLNTYLDYYDSSWNRRTPANSGSFTPAKYGRASDLAFYSGDAKNILGGNQQGHGVFFFAPLGYTAGNASLTDLPNLLNAIGYYVEWGSDKDYPNLRPPFLNPLPEKYRFRLIERIQPTQDFKHYPIFTDGIASNDANGAWIANTVASNTSIANPLADNIIALIIRPEVTSKDAELLFGAGANPWDLTADYIYDSWVGEQRTTSPEKFQFAQLPPMLRVVMVAVSERDVARIQGSSTTPSAALQLSNSLFTNPANLDADLAALSKQLTDAGIEFRIFNQVVPIRSAKFSAQKEN